MPVSNIQRWHNSIQEILSLLEGPKLENPERISEIFRQSLQWEVAWNSDHFRLANSMWDQFMRGLRDRDESILRYRTEYIAEIRQLLLHILDPSHPLTMD